MERDETRFDEGLLYPGTGFWIVHIISAIAVLWIGWRLGKRRRMSFPGMLFDVLRMLNSRR